MSSLRPMMVLMGVRISWLMLEKKWFSAQDIVDAKELGRFDLSSRTRVQEGEPYRQSFEAPDAHIDPDPVDIQPLAPDGEGHGALAGVLDRVVEQVDEDLLDAHLVAAEHTGDGGVHMELEFQPLFLGLDPDLWWACSPACF